MDDTGSLAHKECSDQTSLQGEDEALLGFSFFCFPVVWKTFQVSIAADNFQETKGVSKDDNISMQISPT